MEGCGLWHYNNSAAPTANRIYAMPMVVRSPVVVKKLGWRNGTITTPVNVDVGIYDFYTRQAVVRIGGVQVSVPSSIEWADVSDTPLRPGHYYMAFVADGTGTNFYYWYPTALARIAGCGYISDTWPLPATLPAFSSLDTDTKPVFALVQGGLT